MGCVGSVLRACITTEIRRTSIKSLKRLKSCPMKTNHRFCVSYLLLEDWLAFSLYMVLFSLRLNEYGLFSQGDRQFLPT